MNLPAYLQNSPARKLNEAALAGMGSSLPPHISIRGNTFTLVDASGAEQVAGPTLDVCIADISDVMAKQYYAEKWTPDSNEPPVCWSSNGIGPSREATTPQAATCADCPHNVRGSAVSAISGAAVKACRDEKWLAVILPAMPQIKFQLRLTPGSFKNWQGYVKTCEGSKTDITDVVTRMAFQPGVNGVLSFQAVSYIDEATATQRNAGYAEKAFDALVGRLDKPIAAALPPVQPMSAIAAPVQQVQQPAPLPAPTAAAPAATPSFVPQGQPSAAFIPPAMNGGFAPASAPSASPSEPKRRTRRTAAQIAADNAAQVPASAPAFVPQASAAPVAPFRPAAAPGFGASQQPAFVPAAPPASAPQATFGIQAGAQPNPEMTAALQGIFGKK